jgi:hypothetical protein
VDAQLADLETELCRIPEVTAARVVTDDTGKPTELHILALPDKQAKQVVRDIQSVAMASFGLDLDHRLISVVQLEGQDEPPATSRRTRRTASEPAVAAMDAVRDDVRRADDDDDRVVVEGVLTVRSGLTCSAEVTLERNEERVKGKAEGTLASSAVLRIVAQATLDALRQVEPGAARADVETAMIVRLGERSVAMVTVVLVRPPYEEVMAGAAVVRAAGDHDAVARAVLHAVNRRLSQIP